MNETFARAALVTGSTSGIGRSITELLLADGYLVYGIGRDFSNAPCHPGFFPLPYDLSYFDGLPKLIEGLPCEPKLELLVNAAGVAYYGPHETIHPHRLHEMIAVNIEAPIILSRLLLRTLKETKGTILNISSVTAKQTANTHGCAYGATKAALSSFATSLYEEYRKYGVRVITIHPDLTDTALYRNADFTPIFSPDTCLQPEDIVDTVRLALGARDGMCITDISLRPQKNGIQRKPSKV